MAEIGDKITFIPSAFTCMDKKSDDSWYQRYGIESKVTGTVCMIHREHGWYRVRYVLRGREFFETFKIQ